MPGILIMEDEKGIRNALRVALEKFGYDVAEAPNGKVGMRLQRANPADLVVVDILIPEKDGLETITELRRDFPATKIIAISGGGRLGAHYYLEIAKKMGASSVLEMPFELSDFMAAVKEALGENNASFRLNGSTVIAK